MLEDDRADNQRGIVSTNSINWDNFKEFGRKTNFPEYKKERLFDLQKAYCKTMLEKKT